MFCGPWVGRHEITLNYKLKVDNLWLNLYLALCACNSRSLTIRLTQNLGIEPQNMLWGDSMPSRTPTQIAWLILESLCCHGDLGTESLQLVPNALGVYSALSYFLLKLLHPFIWELCHVAPHLCMLSLNLRKLSFNIHRDCESFINPWMDTHF